MGCTGVDASIGGDAGDSQSTISVEPPGPVLLGFLEQQDFTVVVAGSDGSPLVGEPVQVGFVDQAGNASVAPTEFVTDANGAGHVVLTAPDQVLEFEIRFSSPAVPSPSFVKVGIDPDRVSLSVEAVYSGHRDFDSVEAGVFEALECSALATVQDGGVPDPVETLSSPSLPATFVFHGLKHGVMYAIRILGLNHEGEVRAEACRDSLSPGDPKPQMALADIPLDAAGLFEIVTLIDVGDMLEPAVDDLAGSLEGFVQDPPGAILDGIRDSIEEIDPLAAGTFDQIREEQDLDGLVAADFEERGVDAGAAAEVLWTALRAALQSITLRGTLEIGSPSEGVHQILHSVSELGFQGVEGYFVVASPPPDVGTGTAQADESDVDLMLIGQHQVGLGIGRPLEFLLDSEIQVQGAWSVPSYLESEIGCEAVAEVLAESLTGVAEPATILAGCQGTLVQAGLCVDEGLIHANAHFGQIGFVGSCRLADPGTGDDVEFLEEGQFQVIWSGISTLGPMEATFSGQAVERP